jgi:hypothetical protein
VSGLMISPSSIMTVRASPRTIPSSSSQSSSSELSGSFCFIPLSALLGGNFCRGGRGDFLDPAAAGLLGATLLSVGVSLCTGALLGVGVGSTTVGTGCGAGVSVSSVV